MDGGEGMAGIKVGGHEVNLVCLCLFLHMHTYFIFAYDGKYNYNQMLQSK